MKTTIKWNADKFGVEIKTDTQHFVLSAQPSMVMSWRDAERYYKDNTEWQLPTKEQLVLVSANIDDINNIIMANGGYEIFGILWPSTEVNEFCAWGVNMNSGDISYDIKDDSGFVRPIAVL